MLSGDERRRAADELRRASTGAYRHVDALDVIAVSVGVDTEGKLGHEIEAETYAALADLIDQTTTVDETGVETVADAVHLCECNECGRSFEWVYGEYEYCPRCGSRVVGGNEHEKASNPVPLEGGGAE